MVPAVRVDNPATTGKGRKPNACDSCSLCLGKVGSGSASRATLKSIYHEGKYEYEVRNSSVTKCLNNRHCKACGTGAVTYTFPNTTFGEGEIKRILADTVFPAGSYLLDIVYDVVSELQTIVYDHQAVWSFHASVDGVVVHPSLHIYTLWKTNRR